MKRWVKLARRLTKARPKEALSLIGSIVNRVLSKENVPDINYPNRSITIQHGSKDITIQLAKYQAVLEIDEMLSMDSVGHIQQWLQIQLTHNYGLPQEDTATISALMVQRLQEKEYIKDITPPV